MPRIAAASFASILGNAYPRVIYNFTRIAAASYCLPPNHLPLPSHHPLQQAAVVVGASSLTAMCCFDLYQLPRSSSRSCCTFCGIIYGRTAAAASPRSPYPSSPSTRLSLYPFFMLHACCFRLYIVLVPTNKLPIACCLLLVAPPPLFPPASHTTADAFSLFLHINSFANNHNNLRPPNSGGGAGAEAEAGAAAATATGKQSGAGQGLHRCGSCQHFVSILYCSITLLLLLLLSKCSLELNSCVR